MFCLLFHFCFPFLFLLIYIIFGLFTVFVCYYFKIETKTSFVNVKQRRICKKTETRKRVWSYRADSKKYFSNENILFSPSRRKSEKRVCHILLYFYGFEVWDGLCSESRHVLCRLFNCRQRLPIEISPPTSRLVWNGDSNMMTGWMKEKKLQIKQRFWFKNRFHLRWVNCHLKSNPKTFISVTFFPVVYIVNNYYKVDSMTSKFQKRFIGWSLKMTSF